MMAGPIQSGVRSASSVVQSSNWLAAAALGSPSRRTEPSNDAVEGKPYKYFKNCTEFPTEGPDYDALIAMIDDAIDITYRTFAKYADVRWAATELFDYELDKRQGLTLKDDWSVTYQRSEFKGKRCYIICHSAIEYIFVPCGDDSAENTE